MSHDFGWAFEQMKRGAHVCLPAGRDSDEYWYIKGGKIWVHQDSLSDAPLGFCMGPVIASTNWELYEPKPKDVSPPFNALDVARLVGEVPTDELVAIQDAARGELAKRETPRFCHSFTWAVGKLFVGQTVQYVKCNRLAYAWYVARNGRLYLKDKYGGVTFWYPSIDEMRSVSGWRLYTK